jgi:hypothetical protein
MMKGLDVDVRGRRGGDERDDDGDEDDRWKEGEGGRR